MSTKKLQLLENIFPFNPQAGQVLSTDVNGNKIWVDMPTIPVQSVNGQTGAINLVASDVGALPDTTVVPSIDGLATETYVDNAVARVGTVPSFSATDNGKVLSIVDGALAWVSIDSIITTQNYYTGTTTPDSTTGNDGDLYFKVTR